MAKEANFRAELVAIPENSEGAARILAQIAKPGSPQVGMRKLRDFVMLLDGESPPNNRSREQTKEAASEVWVQVRRAIKVGDWYDRAFASSPGGRIDDRSMGDYPQSLASSLTGLDKETAWAPYKPVAHMAAAFRIAMFKTRRGGFFDASATSRAVHLDQLRELIWDNHDWIRVAVEQAEARMVMNRLHGRQAPAQSRMFILTAPSQETPPISQELPPAP